MDRLDKFGTKDALFRICYGNAVGQGTASKVGIDKASRRADLVERNYAFEEFDSVFHENTDDIATRHAHFE